MVDFIKGIENLNNRFPEHKIVEELSSISGRFVDVNEFPESKTAESLLNVLDTKFKGKEDLFIKVGSFINEESKKIIYMNEPDKIKYKFVLNGLLNFLKSGNIDALEQFNLDEINPYSVHDDVFFDKLKKSLANDVAEEKPRFEISETVINRATVNEKIVKDEKEDEEENDVQHHPLWYVLDNIDEENAGIVSVKNDNSENAEEKEFNGKTVFIGDKSKLNFNETDASASVSVGNKVNTLNISHDKDVDVPNVAMNSTFNGVVDYMEAKGDVPFEFTINTKTEEFKQNFISSIMYFVRKDVITNKITTNSNINGAKVSTLKGKISSFLVDGMSISYDDFATFKSYDDFVAFEERVNARKLDKDKESVRDKLLENEIINNVAR